MTGSTPHRGGRPHLLNFDDTMRNTLGKLGQEGLPQRGVAAALGVCHDTVIAFFRREPEAKRVYEDGLERARKAAKEKGLAAYRVRTERYRARPRAGQVCETCGQIYGSGTGTVTIEISELAKAREKLKRLLDGIDDADTEHPTQPEGAAE